MTPEEIVAELDTKNRELLESIGLTVSQGMVDLLNQAAMKGFQLGSNVACSAIQGALILQLAGINKTGKGDSR